MQNLTHALKKEQPTVTDSTYQISQKKDFRVININMFTKLKKNTINEIKVNMLTMMHQIDNTNKKIRIIKKNQIQIMMLKSNNNRNKKFTREAKD